MKHYMNACEDLGEILSFMVKAFYVLPLYVQSGLLEYTPVAFRVITKEHQCNYVIIVVWK